MGFGKKELGGGEEIKKTPNAMWGKQGIAHHSPTVYLNALTTMLIHYFE